VTLFIDGDAFPNLLKPIVLRSIERLSIPTKVIANKKISIGSSKHVEYIIVEQGADEADHLIVERYQGEWRDDRRSQGFRTKGCPCFCQSVQCFFGQIPLKLSTRSLQERGMNIMILDLT